MGPSLAGCSSPPAARGPTTGRCSPPPKKLGKRGKHIITTAVEHHAILNCMKELEAQGYTVTYLQPDGEGRISLDSLSQALTRDTILVSIMMVNNETGAAMPIAQMAKLVHRSARRPFSIRMRSRAS